MCECVYVLLCIFIGKMGQLRYKHMKVCECMRTTFNKSIHFVCVFVYMYLYLCIYFDDTDTRAAYAFYVYFWSKCALHASNPQILLGICTHAQTRERDTKSLGK